MPMWSSIRLTFNFMMIAVKEKKRQISKAKKKIGSRSYLANYVISCGQNTTKLTTFFPCHYRYCYSYLWHFYQLYHFHTNAKKKKMAIPKWPVSLKFNFIFFLHNILYCIIKLLVVMSRLRRVNKWPQNT